MRDSRPHLNKVVPPMNKHATSRQGVVAIVSPSCATKAGRNRSGSNQTDPDAEPAEIEKHRFGKSLNAELGGVVAGAAANGVSAGSAAHVHDVSYAALPACLLQRRKRGMAAVEDTRQVGFDDLDPHRGSDLLEILDEGNAGIVDQTIQTVEMTASRLDHALD